MRSMLRTLLFICVFASCSLCWAEQFAIVINRGNTAEISKQDIAKLFLGKSKKFSDGARAIAINLPNDSPAKIKFDEQFLGKSPSQMTSYWASVIFSGRAIPITTADNEIEVIEIVSRNPDAIGYVKLENAIESVKILYKF